VWSQRAGVARITVSQRDVDSVSPMPAADPFAAGTAARRVIHGGGLRVAATMIGLLGGLVTAPLVVRHLGNAAFGRYQTGAAVIFVATAVSEGGLGSVAVRAYVIAEGERRRVLIANLLGMRLVLELFALAAAVGFALLVSYPRVLVLGILLGGIGLVFSAQQNSLTVVLQGQLRLAELAGTELASQLIFTALLIGLVVAGAGLLWFFAAAPVLGLIALVLMVVVVRRDAPRRPAFDLGVWRYLIAETAIFAVASALGASYFQVTQVAMSMVSSTAQTGYYAVAFRIVAVVNTVPWVLGGSLLSVFSAMAASDLERLRYIGRRAVEGAAIVGGWFVLVLVLGASFGIEFVGGKPGSVLPLRIMGVGAGATFIVASASYVLIAQRRMRALFAVNLGVFALAIAASTVLIPRLGARGGALCSAGLEFTLLAAYGLLLRRDRITPAASFLGRYAGALALGFGAGLAGLEIHPVVAVAAGSTVYFATLWLTHAIPNELMDAIPSWRRV
jgi:O-antigen/teichoic acid export membrane protein